MVHFLGTYPFQSEQDHQDLCLATPSFFWSDQAANSNVYNWSQGDGSNSGSSISSSTTTESFIVPPPLPYESCYYLNEANPPFGINTYSAPLEFSLMNNQRKDPSISVVPNPSFGDLNCVNDETSSDDREDSCLNLSECAPPKRKSNVSKEENVMEHDKLLGTPAQSSKKKARSSAQVQKCAKRAKRTQKSIRSGDEESNATLNGQSSSCYSSDNDSNGSQDMNGGGSTSSSSKSSAALNLNGKTRAGRGSATDPQSLYARKRRERINERLKVLQNLVPNGTKVDISTMLEEAVQYVKFLQVQIKLLSSDKLWMYAPIAYNGMNIGFDLKTSPRQQK
ncbi:uncharacterized protein [Typha angustifolia]|uniref:uncharacterized protein n=1 Tax=Typha angustifolia TaxID=59011 RepID=UPI003C2DE045